VKSARTSTVVATREAGIAQRESRRNASRRARAVDPERSVLALEFRARNAAAQHSELLAERGVSERASMVVAEECAQERSEDVEGVHAAIVLAMPGRR
jgi:hypothetical protein